MPDYFWITNKKVSDYFWITKKRCRIISGLRKKGVGLFLDYGKKSVGLFLDYEKKVSDYLSLTVDGLGISAALPQLQSKTGQTLEIPPYY